MSTETMTPTPHDRAVIDTAKAEMRAELREKIAEMQRTILLLGQTITGTMMLNLLGNVFADPPEAEKAKAPIPSDVYWRAEHGNFYSFNHHGMGDVFFTKWRGRRGEFPTKPPEQPAVSEGRRIAGELVRPPDENRYPMLCRFDCGEAICVVHFRAGTNVEHARDEIARAIDAALAAQRREFVEMVKTTPRLFDVDAAGIFIDREALLAKFRAGASEGK